MVKNVKMSFLDTVDGKIKLEGWEYISVVHSHLVFTSYLSVIKIFQFTLQFVLEESEMVSR